VAYCRGSGASATGSQFVGSRGWMLNGVHDSVAYCSQLYVSHDCQLILFSSGRGQVEFCSMETIHLFRFYLANFKKRTFYIKYLFLIHYHQF
jgi:hypothetical protein